MKNYFHQDWMVDYDDFNSAVQDFVEHETKDKKEKLIIEINDLLGKNED